MPKRGTTQLPGVPRKYRVDLVQKRRRRLESKVEAQAEAHRRIVGLLQTAKTSTDADQTTAARALAERLRRCWRLDDRCGSAACPLCMRRWRKRFAGHVWKLVVKDRRGKPRTASLIPRGMEYAAGGLSQADAGKLKAQLLAELNRCEAAEADGYLIGGLHGEFEPNEGVFRLHWHLLVSGEMKQVINKLRQRRRYRSREGSGDVVRTRVRMGRKRLRHLPRPLSYLLQSWWPSRRIGKINSGEVKRQRQRNRVPEPHHTEYLLWLDQQPREHLVLLRKLRVTRKGFQRT